MFHGTLELKTKKKIQNKICYTTFRINKNATVSSPKQLQGITNVYFILLLNIIDRIGTIVIF